MEKKAVVFYCKNCDGLFFAATNEARVLQEQTNDITQYIREGHRLDVIGTNSMSNAVWCECSNGKA